MALASLLEAREDSPCLPELNDMLARTPVDLRTVVSAVRRYPALCAQVIRLCNRSLSAAERVMTVEEAVVLLGTERLRTAVLGCLFRRYAGEHVSDTALRIFWQHAYATAWLSEGIARVTGSVQSENAYLAGLVHDVGVLPLLRDPVLMVARSDEEMLETERSRFNTDHCELGGMVAAGWNLSPEVMRVIEHHHDRKLADSLIRVVAAADRFCRFRGICPCYRSPSPEGYRELSLEMLAVCLPQLDSEQRTALFETLDVQFAEIIARPEFEGWPP